MWLREISSCSCSTALPESCLAKICILFSRYLYRDRLKGMQILLSRPQPGPGRAVKQGQLSKIRKKFLATTYKLFSRYLYNPSSAGRLARDERWQFHSLGKITVINDYAVTRSKKFEFGRVRKGQSSKQQETNKFKWKVYIIYGDLLVFFLGCMTIPLYPEASHAT